MLIALSVFLAVTLVTTVFVWSDITRDFDRRKRSLEATGYVFAAALADHVSNRNAPEALRTLRSIARLPEITFAGVTDGQGKAFASFGSAVITSASELEANTGLWAAMRSGAYPVAIDIIKSGERIGQIILIADVSDIASQIAKLLATGLAVAVIAIILSFAVARRLLSRITGPILSLTATIQDMRAAKSYRGRVDVAADGEAGVLIDSFNAMLEEIESRDAALERHRQTLETTVEQRTRELKVARDVAESANEAKSSFLATMSHEIRTPLNGLMVMAELLAGAGLEQRLQRYAEVIVKSGQSLLTIINDILDLSKIEAGKLQLESLPVNPAGVADDVISLFWEKASSKGLDLAARVAPGMPREILADPVRLNQILSNLVNNALKFTEMGHVLISLQYEAGHLVLAVTDSGVGIPQKKLNHLFEAFSQADQTITRKFGGTGLGLAICKRLAEAMGGRIGVKSELGKGSTFWVRVPAAVSTPADAVHYPPMKAAIAIDGLASLSALGTALAANGFQVRTVADDASGADAVFTTASRLKTLDLPESERPKVICLAWMGDPEGEAAVEAGIADDLVLLPLRQQDILDVIDRLHGNRLLGRSALTRRVAALRPKLSFKGRHILVADDNAVNREVIIEVLRQLDVTVEVAINGREALEQWRTRRPDLIFMDCSMPEMDGYTATREIRAHEALAIGGGHTPIVALTAHVVGSDAGTWQKAGMDAYLTKPFTLTQIVACLEAQFSGKPLVHGDATEEAAPAPDGILDPRVLDELRSIGGSTALFRRVLDIFATRVPGAVDHVDALADGSDAQALADAAHALKSMCANIGAQRAVAACHDLEHAARSGEDFDSGELVARIAQEVKAVMREVERLRAA